MRRIGRKIWSCGGVWGDGVEVESQSGMKKLIEGVDQKDAKKIAGRRPTVQIRYAESPPSQFTLT